MTPAERQNFANWYSYYRKREYVMKRAATPLVNSSGLRMGLGTLFDLGAGTPIRDLEENGHPETILKNMASLELNFGGGTPLRNRLEDVGQYYNQEDASSTHTTLGFTDSNPLLPESEGGACQQNFALLMTDGFWNGSSPNIGNNDGDGSSPFDGGSYADEFSDTLADVAMYYYERDLDSELSNSVPIQESINDLNTAQHMVTYTVTFGVSGTLTEGPTDFNTPFNWPNAQPESQSSIDDVRHAAWNGRGQFLSAADPEQLITALSDAISDIEQRAGSAASAAANGGSISTESRIYQAQFESSDWSGKATEFCGQ